MKITASQWRPGAEPVALSPDQVATASDGFLVLTVDATLDAAEEVHRQLQRICGEELTLDMVHDLLDPDDLPEVRQFGEGGRIRKVSSFGVHSLEQKDGPDQEHAVQSVDFLTRDRELVFQPVEFLAGDRWLICHWQRCKVYRLGLAQPGEAEPQFREDIEQDLAERWLDKKGKTSGDLGILFLYELALEYTKARIALWKWLDDGEQNFYGHDVAMDPMPFVAELAELHRLHGELYRRLAGLNVPRTSADTSWFANVTRADTAWRVDEMIDRSLDNLRDFRDSLRQAVNLTQSYATLRHFKLAEEQKKQAEKLQHGFQLVASILLVPTLIAGVYGANTLLPGGDHWSGFIAMVVLMVVGGSAAYWVLRRAGGD